MVHDVSKYYMLEDFATYRCQIYRTVISRQGTISFRKNRSNVSSRPREWKFACVKRFLENMCKAGANSLAAS